MIEKNREREKKREKAEERERTSFWHVEIKKKKTHACIALYGEWRNVVFKKLRWRRRVTWINGGLNRARLKFHQPSFPSVPRFRLSFIILLLPSPPFSPPLFSTFLSGFRAGHRVRIDDGRSNQFYGIAVGTHETRPNARQNRISSATRSLLESRYHEASRSFSCKQHNTCQRDSAAGNGRREIAVMTSSWAAVWLLTRQIGKAYHRIDTMDGQMTIKSIRTR